MNIEELEEVFFLDWTELLEIKKMAMQYVDPIRGKMLAMVTHIELMQAEMDNLQQRVRELEAMRTD